MPNTYRDEFETLPDFLAAVVMAALDGYDVRDPRLIYAAVTGAGETIPSDGGFVVPDQMATDLWQTVYDVGHILDRCARQPVTVGKSLSIPAIDETSRVAGSRFGGVQTFWAAEGATVTAKRPKYRTMTLQPKRLTGITYATEELLADAPALASWLRRIFGLEASFVVEDEIVNGTGAGRLLGVLNSGALLTVAKESGQAAATVVPANLNGMAARLWGPSHKTAIWLMSNDCFAQIANDSFSNGSPVVTTDGQGRRRILSMPVELSEYPPALGSAGDVVLGDFSQYLIAEIGPEFTSSLHVRFLWNEGVFRFIWRIDGQPAWSSAITPKNSSTTQSPFVTLAARA